MSQNYGLLIPFLNEDPAYCYGVEFGMRVVVPMCRGRRLIKGYFRTENEEQIRLAASRMGYDVVELKPWHHGGMETGWVWMKMRRIQRDIVGSTTTEDE